MQTKIDRAKQPFLKSGGGGGGFRKFDRRQGHINDKQQGCFLNLTGNMWLKLDSDRGIPR